MKRIKSLGKTGSGKMEAFIPKYRVKSFEYIGIQSIPWDKVDITIVNLEVAHLGEKNPILERFMIERGYRDQG